LNALKELARLPDELPLIAPAVIDAATNMKKKVLKCKRFSFDLDETLIALSVSTTGNPTAQLAVKQLCKLNGCEMHISHLHISTSRDSVEDIRDPGPRNPYVH
jgi:uncharacterized protein (UPF0371 family)